VDLDIKVVVTPPSEAQPHWRAVVVFKGGPNEFKSTRYAGSKDAAVRGCQATTLRNVAEWIAIGEMEPIISLTFNVVQD
jgi:hypothetical protein